MVYGCKSWQLLKKKSEMYWKRCLAQACPCWNYYMIKLLNLHTRKKLKSENDMVTAFRTYL